MSLHSDRPSANHRNESSPPPMTGSKRPASPTSPGASKKARPEAITRLSTTAVPASGSPGGSASPARRQVIEVLNTPRISSPIPQSTGGVNEDKESVDAPSHEKPTGEKQAAAGTTTTGADGDVEMAEAKVPEAGSVAAPEESREQADKVPETAPETETANVEEPAPMVAIVEESAPANGSAADTESKDANNKDVEMASPTAPASVPVPEDAAAASKPVEEAKGDVLSTTAIEAETAPDVEEKEASEEAVKDNNEKEAGEVEEATSA